AGVGRGSVGTSPARCPRRAFSRGQYSHARRLFENRSLHERMRPVWRVHDRVVRRGDPGVAVDAGSDARIRSGATVGEGQRNTGWTNGRTHGPEAAQADDDLGNDGLRKRSANARSQPAGRVRGAEGAEPEST